ncbi:hypothetical protein J6590_105529, partial [Homalodisca vitripennis]
MGHRGSCVVTSLFLVVAHSTHTKHTTRNYSRGHQIRRVGGIAPLPDWANIGGVWKLQRRRDAWTRQHCAHSVAKLCLRATDSRPSSASPVPYVAAAQIHPP